MTDKIEDIKSRSVRSVISLFFQSGYSAGLGLVANLFLTILLTPAIFGIYITVLSLIAILNYFSDIGLAASLIQREKIDDDDVKTAFTIQQILVTSTVMIGFFASNFITSFYNLPRAGTLLYFSFLFGFFLSSLKTIPSVFLERKIQFQKIVFVQVVENTFFYITVIVLAYMGFGLLSFAYGVILRSIVGVILIYSISFWIPRVGISKKSLKHLVSFGLPFQSISFLALIKDELVNLFLGKVIGFQGLGYIGWAKKWGEAPLRIIMDSLSRVMFPLFSRVQTDKERLRKILEKALRYQTMILFPTIVGLFLLMPRLIQIIPRYHKWETALPLFYIFIIASFFSSFSTPFINLFNALGRVKVSFYFMVFWTITTWILIIPMTKIFGLYGFPMMIFFLSLTFIIVINKAHEFIQFDIVKKNYQFIISGLIMSGAIIALLRISPGNLFGLAASSIIGALIYFFSLLIFFKINLKKEFLRLIEKK